MATKNKFRKPVKKLERNLDEDSLSKYRSVENTLDVIYYYFTEDIRIRRKCEWYDHDKKVVKFFF